MSKEEKVLIIKLKDGEIIKLKNISIKKYQENKTIQLSNNNYGFYIESLQREIAFSQIIEVKEKIEYISLPEPKQNKKFYTEEEKQKHRERTKQILEQTFEGRKKHFIERRLKLLKSLIKEEKQYGLEPILNELERLRKIENKIKLKSL